MKHLKQNWKKGNYNSFYVNRTPTPSRSQLPQLIKYIQNQEQHHKNKTFREEYLEFLEKFDVDYDKKYIFKPIG